MLIALGSENHLKAAALTDACQVLSLSAEFLYGDVDSLVGREPKHDEGPNGAFNRARSIRYRYPRADMWIGIENFLTFRVLRYAWSQASCTVTPFVYESDRPSVDWVDRAAIMIVLKSGESRLFLSEAVDVSGPVMEIIHKSNFSVTFGEALHRLDGRCDTADPHWLVTGCTRSRGMILSDCLRKALMLTLVPRPLMSLAPVSSRIF